MNHANVDSNRMDLHRRIALVLRKEPGLVRDFAERLRSKLAMGRSAAVVLGFACLAIPLTLGLT
jgi:hypothetical protein